MGRLPSWLSAPLLVILILASGLRLPLLNGSLWLDEAAQALESARPFSQQLDIIPDFQPPLLHYLVHFSLYFSDSEWWLRLTAAVIPGLVTIWATYQIGRRLLSTDMGTMAALLLATSSFHIFYSQELRPYALPAMFASLSWWWSVAKSDSINHRKKSLLFWLGWVALSLGGLYSSYLYPFVWISQIGFWAWHYRSSWKALVLSVIGVAAGFAVWIPMFLQQLAAGQELRVALPGWQSVVSFSQLKTLPLVAAKFLFGVINVELNAFFILSTGAVVALTGLLLWPVGRKFLKQRTLPRNVSLVLIWLVVPLVLAWVVSFWVPIIQPKRVLFLMPALYLGVSWLILSSKQTAVARSLGFLLLGLNLFSTVQYFSNPLYQRENWRALQETLSSHYQPEVSLVIFAFPEPFAPWRWYDQGQFETLSLGYINDQNETLAREKITSATQEQFIITFDYLGDLSDPENVVEDELKHLGYQTLEILDYPNIGFVRIWARQGVTVSAASGTIEAPL